MASGRYAAKVKRDAELLAQKKAAAKKAAAKKAATKKAAEAQRVAGLRDVQARSRRGILGRTW
jgi:hypothetical protein